MCLSSKNREDLNLVTEQTKTQVFFNRSTILFPKQLVKCSCSTRTTRTEYTIHSKLSHIYFCYVAADGNNAKVRRLYVEKYPNRTILGAQTFCDIAQRLWDNTTMGTLKPVLSGIRIQYDDTDLGDRTLHRIQQNPNLSTRTITAEKGASNSTVWTIAVRV
ncbi:uncharacterized protein LOC126920546 [Bombus affinis]|uniref:uncharacterized protein LOC126920546 n=1 Tax=Bombus affinis TaxID=309941 RepID=UPI0021B77906|nr:uncharacterized protein LOC126920546 [Bombus affinis]